MSEKHIGKVIQVIGPVLDIQFKDGELPELLNAIEIDNHGEKLVVEVAQHTGDNVARCIAMNSTDGLVRGTDAVDTGESIKVPVGDQCLGRVFNLLGEPVDEQPVRKGRQDRSVRRCRCRQDRSDPGADLQHRHRAQRLLGVHRRRRAHP